MMIPRASEPERDSAGGLRVRSRVVTVPGLVDLTPRWRLDTREIPAGLVSRCIRFRPLDLRVSLITIL